MALEIEDRNIKNQYELLNILDGKASALLTFNAIFLAAISIWLGYVPLNILHLILDIVFIALLISCFYILQVIWLRWGHMEETAQQLDEIRHRRTFCYQRAWKIAAICIFVVAAVSVVHTIGTALVSVGRCSGLCEWFFGQDIFGNLDYGV